MSATTGHQDVITTFQAGTDDPPVMDPAPIDPATILDGAPVARARTQAGTADGRLSTTVWDCTAGRFTWFFGCDEIVHIVEGSVVVTDEQGRSRTLGVGDVALFEKDTTTTWDVAEYVRKVAIHRVTVDALPVRALRKVRGLVAARRG
ncbi:cupin domain-containing protein [Patulibacter minatonensis]|uniref:cupin domain-containing protein n=1 Tax=Patulibacter minatonensis TaxID=298163 RepID=UPI0006870FF3|nr:cupin domain-containing protein [Patulibacter minatonensis]